jgi:hypothetical protein
LKCFSPMPGSGQIIERLVRCVVQIVGSGRAGWFDLRSFVPLIEAGNTNTGRLTLNSCFPHIVIVFPILSDVRSLLISLDWTYFTRSCVNCIPRSNARIDIPWRYGRNELELILHCKCLNFRPPSRRAAFCKSQRTEIGVETIKPS